MTVSASLSLALLLAATNEARDKEPTMTLYDFAAPATTGKWRAVNDGVMGGVSRGGFRILSKKARLEFAGKLSLENNGGFASIRSHGKTHDLSGFDGVALRIRGDGRSYSLMFRTDQLRDGGWYRSEFSTKKGEWVTVKVPFSKLVARWRGRPIPGAPAIDPKGVASVGVLLADERAGSFKLEIDSVKAYRAPASASATADKSARD